jgi:hypothetical protein
VSSRAFERRHAFSQDLSNHQAIAHESAATSPGLSCLDFQMRDLYDLLFALLHRLEPTLPIVQRPLPIKHDLSAMNADCGFLPCILIRNGLFDRMNELPRHECPSFALLCNMLLVVPHGCLRISVAAGPLSLAANTESTELALRIACVLWPPGHDLSISDFVLPADDLASDSRTIQPILVVIKNSLADNLSLRSLE